MVSTPLTCCLPQGGSFIKGTDTQDWSDVDAVLFSDSFTSLEDCRRSLTPALAALEKNLKNTAMTNRWRLLHDMGFITVETFNVLKI